MKRRTILVPVLVLAVIAVAGLLTMRSGKQRDAGLKVTGTIEVTVAELSFKVPGRLQERTVDEGQPVKAGQILARLETDELRQELAVRTAEQGAAHAALADLRAGSRREELAQAEAALARQRAEAERLAKDAVRMEGLYGREVVPLKDLEAAQAARSASAAAVREAEERLKLLRVGPRPDAVRQAAARAESAAAGRALAETRLGQASLVAPLEGLVLAKHAEPGEMLAAGAPVVTVGRMDRVWLRGYIPEDRLARVRLGQAAAVTVDGLSGRTFQGRVSFISPHAEFTPRTVQTEKERVKLVYRIKIDLDNAGFELKPGMPADALLQLSP